MTQIKTPLDIYKLLPKSNCKRCSLPSCLAFSAAVLSGKKQLADCPHIVGSIIGEPQKIDIHKSTLQNREEAADQLRSQIPSIDLPTAAQKVGAKIIGEKLAINCLGKDFFIDSMGNITSEVHTHAWITLMLLDHIISSKGDNPSGQWIPFRELRKGAERNPLFEQLCEKPLKKIADTHTALFEDLLFIFSGHRSTNMFASDISLVLYPLPKVPILICYWKAEGEMEASLHIFFDSTVENHLNLQAIFDLGVALAMMFEKVVLKHERNRFFSSVWRLCPRWLRQSMGRRFAASHSGG